jgi:two-component system sensor histidine kinase DesK
MFTYAASMIPFASESLALTAAAIGAAALMAAGEGVLLHVTPWYWGMFSVFAICAGASNTVVAQRMRSNERLDLAQEQIEHLAKVAERERIARDLHDVLGHTLSVVVLKSELAGKLMARDAARARREIGEVEQIARKALGEVREAISGYRAAGLAAEIERARQALDAAGITLECAAAPPRLQPAHDSVLSLVLREAVTNIIRHAGATRCRLEFAVDGGRTRLLVHDDGRGRIELEGNGLRGMRERVESLGGLLAIDSRQGTLLRIEIPTAAPASA